MYTADDSTEILEPDGTLASTEANPDSCKKSRAHDSRTMPLSSTRSRTLIRSSVLATSGRILDSTQVGCLHKAPRLTLLRFLYARRISESTVKRAESTHFG